MLVAARWRRMASLGATVAVAAALVGASLTSRGFPVDQLTMSDSGVWVVNGSAGAVGRFNVTGETLDGAVFPSYTDLAVLQDGPTVLLRDSTGGGFAPVNTATLTVQAPVALSAQAQLVVGGGVAVVFDPDQGDLWVMPAASTAGFLPDPAVNEPTVTGLPANARVAVGVDGSAYVLDPSASTVTVFPADPRQSRKTIGIASLDTSAEYSMTVAGSTPVVLDRTNRRLYLGARTVVQVDVPGVVLQQPSAASTSVAYETSDSLVVQPLSGGQASVTAVGGGGQPSPPAQLGGCIYAVWSGTASFARVCSDGSKSFTTTVPGVDANAALSLRMNLDRIVLNDATSGAVWLVTGDLARVDDWVAALRRDTAQTTTTQSATDPFQTSRPDRTQPNRPPVAVDDTFGVRPGASTLLPVLENDTDPDGDLLTASLEGAAPPVGALALVYSGSVFQITMPPDATGRESFQYRADDGRGGTASATCTVEVHPFSVNSPPAPVRDTRLSVTAGRKVTFNVLTDWRDPDGDTMILTGASPKTPGDAVTFTADGTVTFQDGGQTPGVKQINVTVSDGTATASGTVQITILPAAVIPPVAVNDLASGLVGDPVVVHPLWNDIDANGLPISLVSVSDNPACDVAMDQQQGVVTFTCRTPGIFYFDYAITNGPSNDQYGLIRLDITAPSPAGDRAPVAVPDTALLHAGQSLLVPVLDNDVNPQPGPLVVVSVQAPVGAPIQATVSGHAQILVTPLRSFTDPVTLTYTVSNGSGSASATITLVPVPAPAVISPPVAVDDQVLVRVGDVTTVNVLANDSQPDGVPIRLLPDLLQIPDPDSQALVFTSGDVIRVEARQTPGTYSVLYQVAATVGDAEPATGRLTIRVIKADPDHNQAPRPLAITARTVSGQPVTIPIPLTGVDPDGDSVTLEGLASTPDRGTITAVAPDSITYTPTGQVTGTTSFTYRVRDRLGLEGVGVVTVGIAAPEATNSPPVAVTDAVAVRPGRAVSIPVTANDYDPDADPVTLVQGSAVSSDFTATTKGERVDFQAPVTAGDYSATYQIQDSFGQTSTGVITVHVSADVPLQKPIPQDDYVPLASAFTAGPVVVDVLANDDDPDGSVADDTIATTASTAAVGGGKVSVTLTPQPQIIAYTLTDPDHLTGQAYIWAPGTDTTPPQAKSGVTGVTVKSGQSVQVALANYVTVRAGRAPLVTAAGRVTAWNGDVHIDSSTTVTFIAPDDYVGAASMSLEVTDGATLSDPTGLTGLITIPVTVQPGDNTHNTPPTMAGASVSVEAGAAGTLNLAPFSTDADNDPLTFAVATQPGLAGLHATIAGTILTVTADPAVAKRSAATMRVSVTDGHNQPVTSNIDINVVASTRPLPQTVPDKIADAHQGVQFCVDATANDVNPFPETPLTVMGAKVMTGDGAVTLGCDGPGSVAVTAGVDFVGMMTVTYTVQDATRDPDRAVDGLITLNVLGRPDPVVGLSVDQVGDRQVGLSWPPPNNNGAKITAYTVTGTPDYKTTCTGTICVLTGLTNNVTYTFTVTATNEVGTSDPSPATVQARPDTVPNRLDPPGATRGDTAAGLSWASKGSNGSPITSYNVEFGLAGTDAAAGQATGATGTSYQWTGLTNGTAYHFRVCAMNLAPLACSDDSMWSDWSAPVTPAGLPKPPGTAPWAQIVGNRTDTDGTQAQVKVCWDPFDPNGDPISNYKIQVVGGAAFTDPGTGNCATLPAQPSQSSPYRFTVSATNGVGQGDDPNVSAPLQITGKPAQVTGQQATGRDGTCTVTFNPVPVTGATAADIHYSVSTSESTWTERGTFPDGAQPSVVIGGLPITGTTTFHIKAQAATLNPATNTVDLSPTSDDVTVNCTQLPPTPPSKTPPPTSATPSGKPSTPSGSPS